MVLSEIKLGPDDPPDASIYSEKRSSKNSPNSKPMQEQVEKRDILVRQSQAIAELALISSPPKTQAIEDYLYYSAAGEGITIYIIDSGLNPSHTDFSLGVVKRRIYANGAAKMGADDDPNSHETCIASKVAGKVFGFAKKASSIFLKRGLNA